MSLMACLMVGLVVGAVVLPIVGSCNVRKRYYHSKCGEKKQE